MTASGATATRDHGQLQHGAALVIALCLLAVLTVLAITGMTTGTLELAMAGNEQARAQAFYAAEAGIEQALAARSFSTDPAAGSAQFDDPAAPDPRPRPGHGTPIAHCPSPPDAAGPRCEYFMRYEVAADATSLPGGVDPGPGRRAYHFAIESVGVAGRGAQVELIQGFYVVASDGEPSACVIGSPSCGIGSADPPVRTYWRQRGVN